MLQTLINNEFSKMSDMTPESSDISYIRYDYDSLITVENVSNHKSVIDYISWQRVYDSIQRNNEFLFAFADPTDYGFPIRRIGRILDNNDLIIVSTGNNEINLGDFHNINSLHYMNLMELPDELTPCIY